MKKPFLLVPTISVAVVICLFMASAAFAAPELTVENGVSIDGSDPNDADDPPGPVFDTGDNIYYVYEYEIYNPDDTNYTYTVNDSLLGPIASGPLPPEGTVSGASQALTSVEEDQNNHTLTVTLTPDGGTPVNYTDEVYYYGVDPTTGIEVDIKPGSDPNSINLRSKGVIPVALIDFDPELLDGLTITIGEVEALRWAVEDVDGDGDDDVICHFKTQELVEAGELEDSTDDLVVRIGSEWNDDVGQYEGGYAGDDSVNIVPPDNAEAKGHAKGSASSSSNKGNNGSKGNNGNKGGNGKGKNK